VGVELSGSCAAASGQFAALAPQLPGTPLSTMDGFYIGEPFRPLLLQLADQGVVNGPVTEPIQLLFIANIKGATGLPFAKTLHLEFTSQIEDGQATSPYSTTGKDGRHVDQSGAEITAVAGFAKVGSVAQHELLQPDAALNQSLGLYEITGAFSPTLPVSLSARTFKLLVFVNDISIGPSASSTFRSFPILPLAGPSTYIDIYRDLQRQMQSPRVYKVLQAVL